MKKTFDTEKKLYTLSLLVQDIPGVLSQVARLFSRKGYNIESIVSGETSQPGLTRICILHRNMPNTISLFAGAVGAAGVNIENMQSMSRGEYAYTLFDVSGEFADSAVTSLEAMEPIIRVRFIR